MSQYVGAVNTHKDEFADTIYTPIGAKPMSFSITSDDDGKFKSLNHAPGLTIFQQNLIKGWAAQLQINAGEISRGNKAFTSTEVSWIILLFQLSKILRPCMVKKITSS